MASLCGSDLAKAKELQEVRDETMELAPVLVETVRMSRDAADAVIALQGPTESPLEKFVEALAVLLAARGLKNLLLAHLRHLDTSLSIDISEIWRQLPP